jgi:thymidylate synthase ThyX
MDAFKEDEAAILKNYVTNTERGVFAIHNLPEVVKGALFSRYSRSDKSLRRVLLDEFIRAKNTGFSELVGSPQTQHAPGESERQAEEFYERVLVSFGDDSIGELAGAHIALEGISIIATKVVEDARIGLSPLEKSTRYVYFDTKEDGKYMYVREKSIMGSAHADAYVQSCDFLFDTYSKLAPKMSKYFEELSPNDGTIGDAGYKRALRGKVCDSLRGLLPASAKTNMGMFGNGRAFEYLLTKMQASNLEEIRALGEGMYEELRKVIPVFVKRSHGPHGKEMADYFNSCDAASRAEIAKIGAPPEHGVRRQSVELAWHDKDGEARVLAAIIYEKTGVSMQDALIRAENLSAGERERMLDAYCGVRKNRRHRPGRAFENCNYSFDICANYGAYRDVHRHRVATQARQLLGTMHGYEVPEHIVKAGFAAEFEDALKHAGKTADAIAKDLPVQSQYAVPLAYRIRWYMTFNLREAYHLCELRSTPHGHEDYRRIAQDMHLRIKEVQPRLAKNMAHMDMAGHKDEFERLASEKKFEKKEEEIRKKYGI